MKWSFIWLLKPGFTLFDDIEDRQTRDGAQRGESAVLVYRVYWFEVRRWLGTGGGKGERDEWNGGGVN